MKVKLYNGESVKIFPDTYVTTKIDCIDCGRTGNTKLPIFEFYPGKHEYFIKEEVWGICQTCKGKGWLDQDNVNELLNQKRYLFGGYDLRYCSVDGRDPREKEQDKLKAFRCVNCGNPEEPEYKDGLYKCTYCGTSYHTFEFEKISVKPKLRGKGGFKLPADGLQKLYYPILIQPPIRVTKYIIEGSKFDNPQFNS